MSSPRHRRFESRRLAAARPGAPTLLLALALLLEGCCFSLFPSAGEERSLGGWFSGHGGVLDSAQATFFGDVYGSMPSSVDSVAFSPNGRLLATLSHDELILWHTVDGRIAWRKEADFGTSFMPREITWSPDGTTLLTTSDKGLLHEFRAADGMLLGSYDAAEQFRRQRDDRPPHFLAAALQGPGQPYAALCSRPESGTRYELVVLGLAQDSEVLSVSRSWDSPGPAAFSRDGRHLMTSGRAPRDNQKATEVEGSAELWSIPDGKLLTRLPSLYDVPEALAYDSERGLLAILDSASVYLWELRPEPRSRRIRLPEWHYDGRIALSYDGRYFAVTYRDAVEVFEVAGGTRVQRFEGHAAPFESVAFAPNGSLLVTGSRDQTAKLWRLSGAGD